MGKPRAGAAGKYFGQVPSVPDYILGQGREGENRKVKRVMHEDPISGRMVPTVQYTRM